LKQLFFSALPVVSGGAASIVSANTIEHVGADVLLVLAATMGYLMLSSFINFGAAFIEPMQVAVGLGKQKGSSIWYCVGGLIVAVLIYIPGFVFLFALPLGGILALSEGWAFSDGWWWVVAAELGGGMALSDGEIETTIGRFVGMLCAAWSIGVSILAVGFIGSPAIARLLRVLSFAIARIGEAEQREDEVTEIDS